MEEFHDSQLASEAELREAHLSGKLSQRR